MSVNRLLDSMKTTFEQRLISAQTVREFAGPYTPRHVLETTFVAPAVLFGVLGGDEPRAEDETMLNHYGAVKAVRFVAICVGKHAKSKTAANREAMLLAQVVAATLDRQDFELDSNTTAYKVRIENLANGVNDGQVCFWKVTWWHGVALDVEQLQIDWANLPNFEGYKSEHFETDADIQSADPLMTTEETYDVEN